jgi:hypothetical protein
MQASGVISGKNNIYDPQGAATRAEAARVAAGLINAAVNKN